MARKPLQSDAQHDFALTRRTAHSLFNRLKPLEPAATAQRHIAQA
jgi:hypothetical protein